MSWRQHLTNRQLYGELLKISSVINERRLRFAGHCHRATEGTIRDVLFWEPKHGKRGRGRPATIYIDSLRKESNLSSMELKKLMDDRDVWRTFIINRQRST